VGDLFSLACGLVDFHLGSQPSSVIQPTEILQAVTEAVRLRKHQINAVGRLITGSFFIYTPGSRIFSLSGQPDFVSATYVDRQIDPVNDMWTQVDIVEIPEIDSDEWQGDYAIAFFGAPDLQAKISWDPALTQFNTLRIWYDPQATEAGTINDDLGVPLRILPMLLARDAALMLLPKCRMRDKNTWDPETVSLFAKINAEARDELVTEFDMWRFEEEGEGQYQAARFSADRRGSRRIPYGRA
jgi:hypothetical protein